MAVAQGIDTTVKRVAQVALGTPGSTGSELVRRVTLDFKKVAPTYASAELASHQQSTGATEGPSHVEATLAGELSAGTYDLEFAHLFRKAFAATTPITALSVTIAGSGPTYTITRSSGWLTDGIKKGDVIRLSVGTLNAANIAKNLLIVTLTQTVATVIPVNGVAMVAEGPITGCTVTVTGKKSYVPSTGHTNIYSSWEKWFSTISKSELFTDVKPASASVTIPATGIATVSIPLVGLGRTLGTAEVLTSPTAETTSDVLAAVQGKVVVNGVVTSITGTQFEVTGNTTTGEPEVGSATLSDLQRGRVGVSGSFTAKFTGTTLQALREAQTVVTLILVIAESALATAEFITFVMPAIKIFTDDADDGEKEIIRTYNFTAQRFGAGGSGTDSEATIISTQDSLAA